MHFQLFFPQKENVFEDEDVDAKSLYGYYLAMIDPIIVISIIQL